MMCLWCVGFMPVQRPGWELPSMGRVALLACVGGLAFVVCTFDSFLT